MLDLEQPTKPEVSVASFIGILCAICGNIVISLALNVQKLAHRRLELENQAAVQERRSGHTRPLSAIQESIDYSEQEEDSLDGSLETRPLLPFPSTERTHSDYGAASSAASSETLTSARRPIPFEFRPDQVPQSTTVIPVEVITEETALRAAAKPSPDREPSEMGEDEEGNESDYLKSKLWWLGFALMNVGEIGNFVSYGYAPASVVAPLGTFALMANCLFAPLLLHERFRKVDLLGMLVAIIGAVTVVFSSNDSDVRLDPEGLIKALSQRAFIIYSIVYAVAAFFLATLSEGKLGKRYVFIDIGLCALFGGFTVLSTKAFSTLLTLQWIEIFTEWITYPVVAVLLLTGASQIRYLNRALMRFDSRVVIPIQFVLFNLSAIVGSAVLYGDFKTASFHQLVTFFYGCSACFLGVFVIAWAPTSEDEDDQDDMNGDTLADSPLEDTGLRRNRATLILPTGVRDTPSLKHRHSTISMMGLSPAQHFLLVHTPPRDSSHFPERHCDLENGMISESLRRRTRATSWFGASVDNLAPNEFGSPSGRVGPHTVRARSKARGREGRDGSPSTPSRRMGPGSLGRTNSGTS